MSGSSSILRSTSHIWEWRFSKRVTTRSARERRAQHASLTGTVHGLDILGVGVGHLLLEGFQPFDLRPAT